MNRYGDTAQLCYRVDGRGLNFPVSCVCVCVWCPCTVYVIRDTTQASGTSQIPGTLTVPRSDSAHVLLNENEKKATPGVLVFEEK